MYLAPIELLALTFVVGIASWRLAFMLVREAGPFGMFDKFRTRVITQPTLGGLFTCVFCMSVWTSVLMLALWFIAWPVVVVFAISGAGLMLASWTGVEYRD